MIRLRNLVLPVNHGPHALEQALREKLGLPAETPLDFSVTRRSIDARRRRQPKLVYTVEVVDSGLPSIPEGPEIQVVQPGSYAWPAPLSDGASRKILIVGAGPSGLFAALWLSRMGYLPVLLERGKPVKSRVADVEGFWQEGRFDGDSNVCFGEGGAGAFSDGKLTSRIKDRHFRCRLVLEELVKAGAPEAILTEAHPHIGTDRLRGVLVGLRKRMEREGVTFRFGDRVRELRVEGGRVSGVVLASGEELFAERVMLAMGHSARDSFEMALRAGVEMMPKAFSIGVRLEQRQAAVDACQFGRWAGHERLGPAEYQLAYHCREKGNKGRSVYTFCMCPGGEVIAANGEAGRVVTNGMSRFRRDGENANAAVLVGVEPADFSGGGPLAGVEFQRRWEEAAFQLGGGGYVAPAQTVRAFLQGQAHHDFGSVCPSYRPGVRPEDLARCLPDFVTYALREGLMAWQNRLADLFPDDAVMTGVETGSSSPFRMVRDQGGQSLGCRGVFPVGEGAGYAGGILSAAVDGIRAAEGLHQTYLEG